MQSESMEYHNNNEACVSILKTIDQTSLPNLSSHMGLPLWQLQKFLTLLQKNSLIEYNQDTEIYRITKKGVKYLNDYNKTIDLLSFKTRNKEEIIA